MQISMVASSLGMPESPPPSSSSYTGILGISEEEREYIDMENLEKSRDRHHQHHHHHHPIPVALRQIVQPDSLQQTSAYYDLVPVSSSACPPSTYLAGGEGPNAVQKDPSGVKMEMERMPAIRENKILGKRKISCHRQNHSEIEKRRRDKMNTYITELASMVPICHANPRKLDKLTVLRMAVQHLRSIRGTVHSYAEDHYKPAFLSDEELRHLVLQAADGFLFVVGCDRGRILFVSESVSQILNYSRSDLLGRSWFDILHPKDVAKVKEQLSASDLNPRERLIDFKIAKWSARRRIISAMLPVKTDLPQGATRLCPGARRSFLCRMKRRSLVQVKEEADSNMIRSKKQHDSDRKYIVIQCTGYLKSWPPAKLGLEEVEGENGTEASCNLSCLVAVGRVQSQVTSSHRWPSSANLKRFPFVTRHAIDGTFLFVDQRATSMLGFLPQELVGTNVYEYFHEEDVRTLSETHKLALESLQVIKTKSYRLRTKDGSYVRIQSEWKPFRNPWTKDVECLISKNSVILSDIGTAVDSGPEVLFEGLTESDRNHDPFSTGSGLQGMVTPYVGASLMGQQVAREAVSTRRKGSPNASTPSPSEGIVPAPSAESSEEGRQGFSLQRMAPADVNSINLSTLKSVYRDSTTLATSAVDSASFSSHVSSDPEMLEMMTRSVANRSPQETTETTNEGNDEAAMAVIMSLLEADAGLGGPVDFSGLPWHLP